jgi:hypothetical protein
MICVIFDLFDTTFYEELNNLSFFYLHKFKKLSYKC